MTEQGIDILVQEGIEGKEEVQPDFQPPNETVSSNTSDSGNGEGFNPDIHESNPDGTPRLTKDGKYRRKRGPVGSRKKEELANNPDNQKKLEAVANTIVMLSTGTMVTILGDEWKPADYEQSMLTQSTAEYLKSIDCYDIPPGVMLLLAITAYVTPRFSMPETQKRLNAIVNRFKGIHNVPENKPNN